MGPTGVPQQKIWSHVSLCKFCLVVFSLDVRPNDYIDLKRPVSWSLLYWYFFSSRFSNLSRKTEKPGNNLTFISYTLRYFIPSIVYSRAACRMIFQHSIHFWDLRVPLVSVIWILVDLLLLEWVIDLLVNTRVLPEQNSRHEIWSSQSRFVFGSVLSRLSGDLINRRSCLKFWEISLF